MKRYTITKSILLILLGVGMSLMLSSYMEDSKKEKERIQKSTQVLKDFSDMKENIPSKLIEQAEGIVIIPKMINAGLGIGGKHGKGVAMVKLASGKWSDPVFITITGGSLGFQAGVQAVDLVLIFKHKDVLAKAKNGDFTIGGDVSAAAGPVGRSSSANTNYTLDAEIYSYSRSKGLFAGISINGSNLSFDKKSNANFYGDGTSTEALFESTSHASADVKALRSTLSAM